MRNKTFFLLTLVLSFGLSNTSAQIQTSAPAKSPPIEGKAISGGVLNGKATSLPKPIYPAAARAVNASGAVNVQVTIDEEGNIISAAAVSGHPLLRQAAEQAARASKFAPTLLQGQPVKVTGVIVYNFVTPMTVTQIGYDFSLAEKSRSFKKSQIIEISKTFPQNWEEEVQALKTLDSRLTTKIVKEESPQISSPMNANTDKLNPPNGISGGNTTGIATRIGSVAIVADSGNYSLDDDSIAIIRELQSKIESRLSANEKILWSFRLGQTLGKLNAEIGNDEKTQANISELNQLDANMPSGVSESVSAKIKELIESFQQTTSAAERKEKLSSLIESLRNMRAY